jgi:hypothetical protein
MGGKRRVGAHRSMTFFADPAKYQYSSCEQLAVHRQTWTTKEQELKQLMDRADQGAGGALVNVLAYKADYVAATEELKLLERASKALLFTRELEQQLRDTLNLLLGKYLSAMYRVRARRGEQFGAQDNSCSRCYRSGLARLHRLAAV